MTDISQALTDLGNAVTAAAGRVSDTLTALNAEIAQLQAQGANTAALQAAADSIEQEVTALSNIAPAVAPAPAPVPDPTPAPSGLVLDTTPLSLTSGQPYVGTLAASGGTGPYSFTASGLPAGVSADQEGNLTGTPTDSSGTTGSVSVGVTDANGATDTGSVPWTVA